MAWRAENRFRWSGLNDAAKVHHRYARRHVLHHGEVVADQQIGEIEFPPEFQQQVEDLRLHGHIERRGRLIADHDVRPHDERSGDGDALALATGKLRGIAVDVVVVEPDPSHHLHHALAPRCEVADPMHA